MENALDAGALTITVDLRDGGTALVRVTDDGIGMAADELPLALERHATSKLTRDEDLDAIATLGFRGEALAAICAVSRFTLTSCARGASDGLRLAGCLHHPAEIRRVQVSRDKAEAFERLQQRRQHGDDVVHHGLAHCAIFQFNAAAALSRASSDRSRSARRQM